MSDGPFFVEDIDYEAAAELVAFRIGSVLQDGHAREVRRLALAGQLGPSVKDLYESGDELLQHAWPGYGDTDGRWVADPQWAAKVLAHHWPQVPNYGDIHDIEPGRSVPDAEGIRPRMARTTQRRSDKDMGDGRTPTAVDVLTGGFPRQDYSVAGLRGGLAGDRGALWWEFHRLIAELNPTWVVGENVPGLLSSRGGADFETIVRSLTDLGYGVVWRVLDAQWFGVAQRRRRVFIVGHSGGQPRPEILALGQSVSGDSPPSREKGPAVAALTASGLGGGGPDDNDAQGGRLVAFAQNSRNEVRDLGGVAGALAAQPGMKQQTYLAQPAVRRLTPLECERLQGFPDGWTAIPGNSDSQRYRQLGNAVAVPVVEWIMRRIGEES